MNSKYIYRFGFKHDEAWAWHIGLFFCIEPKCMDGKRDMYLFFCVGKHDFSIGFMHLESENMI
uniref:Uncharacterized protein n=1 Tax=Dulem virus 35 TaxID=3145753 RepID=A0AAU8AZR0_9CAUD